MRIEISSFFYLIGLVLAGGCSLLPSLAAAAPALTVSSLGANLSGNLEWLIEVTPDPALFATTDLGLGGSVAVELAFEVSGGDLLGATVNHTDWPLDVGGNKPFTSAVTSGAQIDLLGNTLFTSLLSEFLIVNTAVEVLTLETAGSNCTTVSWGGHTLLEGMADAYEGSLIAQAGQNFTAYKGSLTEPDIDGDFDADCDVDGGDFVAWQQHFGAPYTGTDLADWEMHFGTVAPLSASTAVVPEPSTALLLGIALLCHRGFPAVSLRSIT